MRSLPLALLLAATSGCLKPFPEGPVVTSTDTGMTLTDPDDADGDGTPAPADCDDGDPAVHPGADELCDLVDNDCDQAIDEDAVDALTWYADSDGDDYGDPSVSQRACGQPANTTDNDKDCDDANATVHPYAPEQCDELDNDCDNTVDEGVGDTFYTDADGDGWGDDAKVIVACELPPNAAAQGGDCDDTDARFHPDAPESDCSDPNDYNCDGSVGFDDADGDGFAACQDCNDALAGVNPNADEVCDPANLDEDCDLAADDADPQGPVSGQTSFYTDADGDGYGDVGAVAVQRCDATPALAPTHDDCNDALAAVNPGAQEVCDAADVDEDCDLKADDADLSAIGQTDWYLDGDDDGHGDVNDAPRTACDPKATEAGTNDDCDDAKAAIHPGADEICDAGDIDQDCDGLADEADPSTVDLVSAYDDADNDGHGDPATEVLVCDVTPAQATVGDDCDDTDATRNPGEQEVCDAGDVDEDCDLKADDADPDAIGQITWYDDGDGDGFGDPTGGRDACDPIGGEVAIGTDCDDADADTYPGAVELCDGAQNDCSDGGWTSDAGQVTWDAPAGPVSLTASFAAGSPGAPAAIALPTTGTVTVCAGTYDVALTASGGTVDLVGFTGAFGDVVLSGGTVARPLTVDGATVTVSDLTLSDGAAIQGGDVAVIGAGDLSFDHALITAGVATDGGGAYVEAGSALTLDDTDVTESTASRGGALYVDGGSVTTSLSAFTGNDASSAGGAIYLTAAGDITESNLVVSGNTAPVGAGGWMDTGTFDCSGLNASFLNNTATVSGGAFEVVGGALTSAACDWPVNIPDDIHTPVGAYTYGLNATFTCTAAGCF